MRPGLPDAEHRTTRVGGDPHPADVHHVERLRQQLTASGVDLRRRVVGIVSGQVGRPERRHLRRAHFRADASDRPAADLAHRVTACLRRSVLDLPAEQARVERLRLADIVDAQIDPARRSRRPGSIARDHLSSMCTAPVLRGRVWPGGWRGQRTAAGAASTVVRKHTSGCAGSSGYAGYSDCSGCFGCGHRCAPTVRERRSGRHAL